MVSRHRVALISATTTSTTHWRFSLISLLTVSSSVSPFYYHRTSIAAAALQQTHHNYSTSRRRNSWWVTTNHYDSLFRRPKKLQPFAQHHQQGKFALHLRTGNNYNIGSNTILKMGSTFSKQKRSSTPQPTSTSQPSSPQGAAASSKPASPSQPASPQKASPQKASSAKPSSLSSNPSPIKWDAAKSIALPKCILPLSPTGHKGSSGRIGVLGGSARYTGAPYYAAMAALQVGADLASVFCAEEATLPIKCYSPELMVSPVYRAADFDPVAEALQNEEAAEGDDNIEKTKERSEQLIQRMVKEVVSMMDRLHVLIIGPGLGRCPLVVEATARIIQEARKRDLALVLDADALHLLTIKKYQTLLQGYPKAVLTPNPVEYQRMQKAMQPSDDDNESNNDVIAMNQALDQIILVIKGQHDEVLRMTAATKEKAGATPEEAIKSSSSSLICGEEGGLKRSGGIGDILAGTLGTCVAWHEIMQKQGEKKQQKQDNEPSSSTTDKKEEDWLVWSCWTACCIVKSATKRTFEIQRRAMTAPDILRELGPTLDQMSSTPSPYRDRS